MSRARPSSPEEITDELNDLIYTPVVGNGSASHLAPLALDIPSVDTTQRAADPEGSRPAGPVIEIPRGSTAQRVHGPEGLKPPSAKTKTAIRKIGAAKATLTASGKLLYFAMYGPNSGEPIKTCAKGYRELAYAAGIDKDTVRDLMEDLKAKGIVREIRSHDSKQNLGKTYEVRSLIAVHAAWRAAGITHMTAARKPVLCDPMGNIRQPCGWETQRVCSPEGESPPAPVGVPETGPVGARPTPIERKRENTERTSSSPAISAIQVTGNVSEDFRQETGRRPEDGTSHAQLVELLHTELGFVDDAAVAQIISDCRQRAPDVTTEELLDMTKATIERKGNMRRMQNPVGYLIRQIPQCFEGESFRQYRAGKQREREAIEALTARIAAEMKEILADPERTSEHEMARQVLSTNPGILGGNLR